MAKYRIMFSKGDSVKYISHLDLAKLMHRAFRRAGIQVAYSEGFNPHPKMALASALRLGTTSSAEYLDVELEKEMSRLDICSRLGESLPSGLQIKEVREIDKETPPVMATVNAAAYRLVFKRVTKNSDALKILQDLLGEDQILILRNTKKGEKEVDIRPLIYCADVIKQDDTSAVVDVLLGASDQGTARPEEVASLLCEKGLCENEENMSLCRIGLYRRYPDGSTRTPFEVLSKESLVNPAPPAYKE